MNFFSYLCTKLKFHMPKRTPEIEQLLVDVEEKFGTKPHSPADFNELIIAIKKETNASIGLSTLECMNASVSIFAMCLWTSSKTLLCYNGKTSFRSSTMVCPMDR